MKAYTQQADTFISAIGQGRFFTLEYFKKGSVLIDIGISNENNKNYGDIHPENLSEHVLARSPFPGGVGPITVSALFANLAQLIK